MAISHDELFLDFMIPKDRDVLVTRLSGHTVRKLKNQPLTRVDLHIRELEERLRRKIAWSERSPEQVCLLRYWWKRFSMFLTGRLLAVTRSKVCKARRGWLILASRYRRRQHEAICYEATDSVIHECQQAGFTMRTHGAGWPHRRARNRCLVCVANYIRSDDPAVRKKLIARARNSWEDVPAQQNSIITHVVHTHGDLGVSRFCIGCKKLCASEKGVFMHSARCKTLHRALAS